MLKKSKIVLVSAVMGGLLLAGAVSAAAAVIGSGEASTIISAEVKTSTINLTLGDLTTFTANGSLVYDDSKPEQDELVKTVSLHAVKQNQDGDPEANYVYNGTFKAKMENGAGSELASLIKMTVEYKSTKDSEAEFATLTGVGEVAVNTWGDDSTEEGKVNKVKLHFAWADGANEEDIIAQKDKTIKVTVEFVKKVEAAPAASVLAAYRLVGLDALAGTEEFSEWEYENGMLGENYPTDEEHVVEQRKYQFTAVAGDEFGFKTAADGWVGKDNFDGNWTLVDGNAGNIKINETGDYAAYLKLYEDESIRIWLNKESAQQPEQPAETYPVPFTCDRTLSFGEAVYVAGDFSNWKIYQANKLEFDGDENTWKGTIQLTAGTHQYKFVKGDYSAEDGTQPGDDDWLTQGDNLVIEVTAPASGD